jgi:hypothetical protein
VKFFKQGGSCLAFDMPRSKSHKASKMKASPLAQGDDFRWAIFFRFIKVNGGMASD